LSEKEAIMTEKSLDNRSPCLREIVTKPNSFLQKHPNA
jgi:hypothetical protein